MATITMVAPNGIVGQVQTEYGNYPIDPLTGQVVVDSRLLRVLTDAGFVLASASVVTQQQLLQQLAQYTQPADVVAAIKSMISGAAPPSETNAGAAGAANNIAAGGHSHPRLSEVLSGVLDASGQAQIVFTKKYSVTPGLTFISIASGKPVTWDFAMAAPVGGLLPGGTLTGKSSSTLPTLTAILTDLLKLSAFNPFNSPAANVSFTGFAIRSAADPITG